MSDEPVYQWQRKRTGGEWEDMSNPHPNSPLARTFPHPIAPQEIYDDGLGNLYRQIRVNR